MFLRAEKVSRKRAFVELIRSVNAFEFVVSFRPT